MTSITALVDLIAARAHLQDALPRLTGKSRAKAKALIDDLAALIAAVGNS